jgi:hypothetical protein
LRLLGPQRRSHRPSRLVRPRHWLPPLHLHRSGSRRAARDRRGQSRRSHSRSRGPRPSQPALCYSRNLETSPRPTPRFPRRCLILFFPWCCQRKSRSSPSTTQNRASGKGAWSSPFVRGSRADILAETWRMLRSSRCTAGAGSPGWVLAMGPFPGHAHGDDQHAARPGRHGVHRQPHGR